MSKQSYNSAWQLEKYHRRRQYALELLGGCCASCGSTDSPEIDHVDRATKSFSIGRSWSGRWEEFVKELAKCQLLCKTCHTAKSREESSGPHGTWGAWNNRKCRCKECRAFVNAYQRDYKRRKRQAATAS